MQTENISKKLISQYYIKLLTYAVLKITLSCQTDTILGWWWDFQVPGYLFSLVHNLSKEAN